MKKLVLFLAIAGVIGFSACSNKTQQTTAPATEQVPAAAPADSTAAAPADSTATPAK